MTTLDQLGIKSYPVEGGHLLAHFDGIYINFCAVSINDEGKVTCSEGAVLPDKFQDPQIVFDEHIIADTRRSVPWAFALMGHENKKPLVAVLNIPAVTRADVLVSLSSALQSVKDEISSKIDGRALKAMSKAAVKTVNSLSFYSGDTDRAVIRRQAAASYPILADHMASNLTAKMAIDRSKPLEAIITTLLGHVVDGDVPKAALKRLAAADEIPEGDSYEHIIKFMSLVPSDWIPSSGPNWTAFCAVADGLFSSLGCLDSQVQDLIKGCGGKWEEFCARVNKKAGVAEPDVALGFKYSMANVAEVVDAFSDVVVLPLAAHSGISNLIMVTPEMRVKARETSLAMLVSGRNAADLGDMQRRWHQSRNTILGVTSLLEAEKRAALKGSVEEGSWPGLTERVQAPNGVWIVPLTSPTQLVEEGDAMGHCVGGYAGRASKCQCFIVSLRVIDPDTGVEKSQSTAEINELSDDSDALTVQQHRGWKNIAAPLKAQDAFHWYLAAIRAGVVPIQRQLINAFVDKEHVPDDGVERLAGFDWREPDLINATIAPWGPFVVSPFKSYGLDELLDCEEIRQVADLIAPEIMARMR